VPLVLLSDRIKLSFYLLQPDQSLGVRDLISRFAVILACAIILLQLVDGFDFTPQLSDARFVHDEDEVALKTIALMRETLVTLTVAVSFCQRNLESSSSSQSRKLRF
jgi:hypothetical protein